VPDRPYVYVRLRPVEFLFTHKLFVSLPLKDRLIGKLLRHSLNLGDNFFGHVLRRLVVTFEMHR
jgi:hypothetical protein